MLDLPAERIAEAIGAEHSGEGAAAAALRVTIDSRRAGAGDLFFGLRGAAHDGGAFAGPALRAGAWGVAVEHAHAAAARAACGEDQHVFAVDDTLAALGALANAWRRELGAVVIGVTGSTGKTSTKDILAALLAKTRTVVATPENFNTEIGLPLTLLGAARGTDALVLEMAMRGPGQIGELARIAEPNVGCIVNVGPVHLEQLGSLAAVAAAKAELVAELAPGATAVLPAGEPLLEPHVRSDLRNITFGRGGDVRRLDEDAPQTLSTAGDRSARPSLAIVTPSGTVRIAPSFGEDYLLQNLLAAVACAEAIGAPADGELNVTFSALRGELLEVLGGVNVINDCYNANPVSMRAALDNLARARGRKIAVLGGMAELGADSARFHREVATHAGNAGVDLLIAVGELAAAYAGGYNGSLELAASPDVAAGLVRRVAEPGDTVLIKGSRSVGLEAVAEELLAASHAGGAPPRREARG